MPNITARLASLEAVASAREARIARRRTARAEGILASLAHLSDDELEAMARADGLSDEARQVFDSLTTEQLERIVTGEPIPMVVPRTAGTARLLDELAALARA